MKAEKFEVKFKEGVYGFIYDSQFGEVKNVFTWKLNKDEIKALESRKGVLCEALGMDSEYDCLFTNIKEVNEVFEFDGNSLECNEEGLNKALEYVN